MPGPPTLVLQIPKDGQTTLSTSQWLALQNNINNLVSQFLPLIGGTLQGTIGFSPGQLFPGGQVQVTDPSYTHGSTWRTIQDHINDSTVHTASATPIPHAFAHQMGGYDVLYGDLLLISNSIPNQTIKGYIDASIANNLPVPSYAPSSYYEIGGGDPLFGNQIAITSASGTYDIKTYVDNKIASSVSAGASSSPVFDSIVLDNAASEIQWTVGNLKLVDFGGVSALFSDGTNLFLQPHTGGVINIGSPASAAGYGQLSSNGYTVGSTNIGPAGGIINGGLTLNNDLVANRTAAGNASAGGINLAGTTISYNADIPGQLYLGAPTYIPGNLTLANNSRVLVTGSMTLGASGSALPGISSNGTSISLSAVSGGSINLGTASSSLASILLGPVGAWGSFAATGYTIGTSTYGASSLLVAGYGSFNSGYTATAGDVGIARTATSGRLGFGRTSSNWLDFGVTANNTFTFATSATIAQIQPSGAYIAGLSSYGPVGATVNGPVNALATVAAASGVTFNGLGGFSFTGLSTGDVGMFSNGGNDLRFYCGSSSLALAFQNSGQTAQFLGTVASPTVQSTYLAVSGAATIGGLVTLGGGLLGAGVNVQKFRVKDNLFLGFTTGTIALSATYPNIVVPSFVAGQIDMLRLACINPDNTATATTFTIYKNGVSIGQVAFVEGANTASAIPINNPTPIVLGDQLQAVCTQAGTATGVSVILEISQAIY